MATWEEVLGGTGGDYDKAQTILTNAATTVHAGQSLDEKLNHMTIPQIDSAIKVLESKKGSVESPGMQTKFKALTNQYTMAKRKIEQTYEVAQDKASTDKNVMGLISGKKDFLNLALLGDSTKWNAVSDKKDNLKYGFFNQMGDFFTASGLPIDKICIGLGITAGAFGAIGALTGGGALAIFSNPLFMGVLGAVGIGAAICAIPSIIKGIKKVHENKIALESLKEEMELADVEAQAEARRAGEKAAISTQGLSYLLNKPYLITEENKDLIKQGMIKSLTSQKDFNDFLSSASLNSEQTVIIVQAYNEAKGEIEKLNSTIKDAKSGFDGETLTEELFIGEAFTKNKDAIVEFMVKNESVYGSVSDFTKLPGATDTLSVEAQGNFRKAVNEARDKIRELHNSDDKERLAEEAKTNYDNFKKAIPSTGFATLTAALTEIKGKHLTIDQVKTFETDTSLSENQRKFAKEAVLVLNKKADIEKTALDQSKFEEVYSETNNFAYSDELKTELGDVFTNAEKTHKDVEKINGYDFATKYNQIISDSASLPPYAQDAVKEKLNKAKEIKQAVDNYKDLKSNYDENYNLATEISKIEDTTVKEAVIATYNKGTKYYDNGLEDVKTVEKIERADLDSENGYKQVIELKGKLHVSDISKLDSEIQEKISKAETIEKNVDKIKGKNPAVDYVEILDLCEEIPEKVQKNNSDIKDKIKEAKAKSEETKGKVTSTAVDLLRDFEESLDKLKGKPNSDFITELDRIESRIKGYKVPEELKEDEQKSLLSWIDMQRAYHKGPSDKNEHRQKEGDDFDRTNDPTGTTGLKTGASEQENNAYRIQEKFYQLLDSKQFNETNANKLKQSIEDAYTSGLINETQKKNLSTMVDMQLALAVEKGS